MSPSTPVNEGPLPPPVISPGGTWNIHTVSVGCKVYITRPLGSDGKIEQRLAEILSIRDKPVNPYTRRNKDVKEEDTSEGQKPEDNLEFFVHWDQFNKRLDEWVSGSRIVTSRDLEWPRPKAPATKKGSNNNSATSTPKAPAKVPRNQNLLKRATSNAAVAASPTPFSGDRVSSPSPTPPSLKRKTPHDEEEDEDPDADADGDMDVDGEGDFETFDLSLTEPFTDSQEPAPLSAFSKEQEIEKLRVSGSMTQSVSEIARVKNLNRLQIGKHEVETWYFSPYPQEYAHLPVLYICEFCLSFYPSEFMLTRHRQRCTMMHPPGNEIYRHEDISFYEIDGKRQLTWCRNLSLLSKCFLDHKTLYYDVTPFMYYVMVQRDSVGCHIIGYFSKEKESAENYNVACILTLPQHQRHGYGKLLIEFSYELSKKEGKLGSPEKPLSDLGLLGYRAYWGEIIVELLLNSDGEISIDEIAQKTSITHADVMNTCITLQLFKHYKGQHLIVLNNAVLERHEKIRKKNRRRIHPEDLKWKPPVFTRDQLRFGW
ncbi:histone acetyltransferase [Dendrothele bispora CBS 962.96]|uniref:histone acetyltransferase n=1 Tax=Dendrothele bispora (strain CBS 962.96) TaxID=1314807 RepID=A0A4S8MI80_DENBC|nr:histone acetyltransferase [Dendrothele bispora CBS 962.96]